MKKKLEFPAIHDAAELCQLINSAYRGKHGWTKESDIVSGERITLEDTKALITDQETHILIVKENSSIIACVCIEQKGSQAYIGLLAVNSNYQNRGLGKEVLFLAEEYALNQFCCKQYVMLVVSQRDELIAFYERRGYIKTGETEKYPVHLNVGIPTEENLTIEYLTKKA